VNYILFSFKPKVKGRITIFILPELPPS